MNEASYIDVDYIRIKCLECGVVTMLRRPAGHRKDCSKAPGFHLLTEREMQVARLLASGKTVKEVATEFNLAVKTVETHKHTIFGKLKVHTTAEMTRRFIYEVELIDRAWQTSVVSPTSQEPSQ
jgi:DNA-binding NarL/FixJ family response regulator